MNFFDDEAAEGTSESSDSLMPGLHHMPVSFQGSRPPKHRRVNDGSHPPRGSSTDEEIQLENYDLPSSNEIHSDDDLHEQRKSKYLTHVPEYGGPHENTFVTQTDRLHSSPSRIRGPRWRKKSPTLSPQTEPSNPVRQASTRVDRNLGSAFDDFDEDPALFEALLSSPAQKIGRNQPLNVSSSSEPGAATRQSRPLQSNFRQTTLFGHRSPQKDVQSSQSRRNWPLADRAEPLTHHKLDYDSLTTWIYPTNLGKTRDYQFNIVQRGLYHNLLVALPTGLGKTFIAATVMLNWFRWTKDAQIVFVAPTKPLVAQQVDACFNIAGIPRSQTTMLVGNVQPAIRVEEWQRKRVFFMTPQTLINDLKSGICDPKRIVLLVVDEAHRARGGYAYVEVVKFLRRFNSSFRVLALTATPGSTVETVQDVIDGLDIARCEIRTEESLDIREFVHNKNIEPVTFDNSEELSMSLELFANAVRPVMGKLASQNAYWSRDPLSITQFGLKTAVDNWSKSAGRNAGPEIKGMVRAIFNTLSKLATPVELLKYHGIGQCYHKLKAFETEALSGKSKYAKQIATDEHFKKLMNCMKAWVNDSEFEGHPKMSYLKNLVLNHFLDASEGRGAAGGEPPSNTRIMVFTHYRDSAEEITRVLNRQEMIRAHVFVGQAASNTSEGMDQKNQQDVITKFKKGTYNVLVATSIGEEGLDIGEVDLIVCYDCAKSPIRMLQRFGRTGRKRAGNVVVLLMKGKEESNLEQAKDNYRKIQELIAKGREFRYHDDRSPRIVPKEMKPIVDMRIVAIPIENSQSELPEPRNRAQKNAKKPPKRFNMPADVETGFTFLGNGKKFRESLPKKRQKKSLLDGEIASLPSFDTYILSAAEETDLERRYAQVDGPEAVQMVYPPRIDAFSEQLFQLSRTAKVEHSVATRRLVAAHQAMHDPDRNWTRPRNSEVIRSGSYVMLDSAIPLSQATQMMTNRRKRSYTIRSSGTVKPMDAHEDHINFTDHDAQEVSIEDEMMEDILDTDLCPSRKPTVVDEPFYVSQKSIRDDEDLDDVLPDFASMVCAKGAKKEAGKVDSCPRTKAVRQISDDEDDS